jgi:hypothetical protein
MLPEDIDERLNREGHVRVSNHPHPDPSLVCVNDSIAKELGGDYVNTHVKTLLRVLNQIQHVAVTKNKSFREGFVKMSQMACMKL